MTQAAGCYLGPKLPALNFASSVAGTMPAALLVLVGMGEPMNDRVRPDGVDMPYAGDSTGEPVLSRPSRLGDFARASGLPPGYSVA